MVGRGFVLAQANENPIALHSASVTIDGVSRNIMWVVDDSPQNNQIYAYDLSEKTLISSQNIQLFLAGNRNPRWTNVVRLTLLLESTVPLTAATATVENGIVTGITVTNGGSRYTVAPTVTLTGGGGSDAIARAMINEDRGVVTSITVTSGGSGYITPPTVNFNVIPWWETFIEWLRLRAIATIHYVRRDAEEITLTINVSVFCFRRVNLSEAEGLIRARLIELFRTQVGSLGRSYYLSNLYEFIETIRDEHGEIVDYLNLNQPLEDVLIKRHEYINLDLDNLVITTQYSQRSNDV